MIVLRACSSVEVYECIYMCIACMLCTQMCMCPAEYRGRDRDGGTLTQAAPREGGVCVCVTCVHMHMCGVYNFAMRFTISSTLQAALEVAGECV